MRKTILFLLAILSYGIAPGQLPQCDLKMEISASTPARITLDSGEASPIIYLKITNLGPDDLDTTDYIYYKIFPMPNSFIAVDETTGGKKYLAAGDSMTIRTISVRHTMQTSQDQELHMCFALVSGDTVNNFFTDTVQENDTTCQVITLKATSTPSSLGNITTGNFSIYPNPASDHINIQYNDNNTGSRPLTITVYDVQGRQLYRREETVSGQDHTRIDITSLHPGAYLLEIRDAEGAAHKQKFLKY